MELKQTSTSNSAGNGFCLYSTISSTFNICDRWFSLTYEYFRAVSQNQVSLPLGKLNNVKLRISATSSHLYLSLSFTPTHKLFVSCSDDAIRVWCWHNFLTIRLWFALLCASIISSLIHIIAHSSHGTKSMLCCLFFKCVSNTNDYVFWINIYALENKCVYSIIYSANIIIRLFVIITFFCFLGALKIFR